MTRHAVYLEIAEDGRCMAHVPELPGCIVRAPARNQALAQLPGVIRDYYAWLRRHGEPSRSGEEPIEIEIAGESSGIGPFDPGSAAALFPPDRKPLSSQEIKDLFRLMAHSRADLLALVRDLPDEVMDYQPHPDSFSIRRLLRHVGNAEEWYVSRLVSPETLPPEWEHDEDLPLFEFLEMERRTAQARLCQLTEAERSNVLYSTVWTDHPQEPWTARKALRRFLEHEREHTAQAREILAARRRCLLAGMTAERAGLMWQLIGLDEKKLTNEPIVKDWTVKDVLAHIAAWDRWEDKTMQCMLAGDVPDLSAAQDVDAFNATIVAEWRDRTLNEVLAELQAARADWVSWLSSLPEKELFQRRFVQGGDWSFPGCLEVQRRHDAEHAAQIATWREAEKLEKGTGPKKVLLAGLAAARHELLAATALVPLEGRTSRRVCGEWTLKDVLGHIADWEWLGVEGLRHMAAGDAPQIEHVTDFDAWNRDHVRARHEQPWKTVWNDLHGARRAMLEVLGKLNETDLARSFPSPWGSEITPYSWTCIFLSHDREHASGLREPCE